jgi:type I restriction enzyme S subunit
MIEGLKPYAEYKESGHEWLGKVPKHWKTPRIKTVLREKDARSPDGSGLLLSLTRNRGLISRSDMTDKVHSARTLAGYKLYEPGEIVMNRMQAWSGMFGAGNSHGLVSPDYAVFKILGENHVSLLLARIKAPDLVSQFASESKGIGTGFNRLYTDKLGAIAISLPPPSEQLAIVRFLDHANRKIDGFIRAKRKLIGLLNEQKQAIIHRAVTRGLDPNAKLKPSGIPWLGEIPAHWGVSCLRMRYSVELGKMLDAKKITGRHLIPYLRNRDVQWDKIRVHDLPLMDISPGEFPRYTVRKGDLMVCEGGQVGRCAFWNEELPICGFQKALHRIRASKPSRDFPRFFFYQMQLAAGLGIFAADGNESTIAHLTCEKLRRHRFSFPPFTEQESIAQYLDSELQTLTIAIARTEREIALMQEYRTRLTADLVTGKLDVREAAAKLPEEKAEEIVEADLSEDETELEEIES